MLVSLRCRAEHAFRPRGRARSAGGDRDRAGLDIGSTLLTDEPSRIVALDYGRRRIGVAVSDPTGTIASPRGFIDRGKKSAATKIPQELAELIADVRPRVVVVGIPFSMDGSAGEMAVEVRAFAAALEQATGVKIVEWDERLTSSRAEREIRSLDLRRSKRREKGRTDEMAATLMLTDYLRSVPGPG